MKYLESFTTLLLAIFLSLFAATLVSTVDADAGAYVMACGAILSLVCLPLGVRIAPKTGVAGANVYTFQFNQVNGGAPSFVAGDAANAKQLCRAIGYLWLMSKNGMSIGTNLRTNVKGASTVILNFLSKYRLLSKLEPKTPDTATGGTEYNASANCVGALVSEDSACTDVITNLDQKLVVRGSLIVAVTLGGVDISDEMTTQIKLPIGTDGGGTQYLWVGLANTDQTDGIYPTPFSSALAYATLGQAVTASGTTAQPASK